MTKVVVNATFGGFSLSREAAAQLDLPIAVGSFGSPYDVVGEDELSRTDSRLVSVVDSMASRASGPDSDLVVLNIPDGVDWGIANHDGKEWVAERHRQWRPVSSDNPEYPGRSQTPEPIVGVGP